MSKLIYAPSLAAFKRAYPDWDKEVSTVYRSVGYTTDGYLYTHGKLFKMSVEGEENPWGLSVALTGQSLGITLSGHTESVNLPVIDVVTTALDDLSISKAAGVYTAIHKEKFATAYNGGAVASNTSILIPKISVSKTGHITGWGEVTATLNHVLIVENTTSTDVKMLFGMGAGTQGAQFNPNLKANLANGSLYATTIYENNVALQNKYAPTIHAVAGTTYGIGTSAVYGHVKLLDSIASGSAAGSGIAATPKSVLDALNAAKAYSEELLGTTDAMLFVGTINGTGVIQTHNATVIPTGVVDGTTNISALTGYSAGWTFKVTTVGTIASIGKVEPGDMIIASSDFVTAYKATDWSVIQANIDGAVSIASNLVANTVTLGASATTVKSLANGSNGQYLIINGGIPTWTSVGANMRAIELNGAAFLASNVTTALDLTAGTGITLTGNATTGAITVNNTGVLNTFALGISNDSASVLSYQPKTAAATIKFNGGLKAVANGPEATISHSTSSPTKTTGLYEMAVDAYGHVVAGTEVTSLPNTAGLIFANAGGATIDTYIGSALKTLKFANGTDITLATTSASNVITVTPSITHRYRGIAFQASGLPTATTVYGDTTGGVVTFKAGSNVNIANAAGVLTFTATDTNTWRNVKAIIAGTTAIAEVLSSSIGVADLEFGSDFLWTEAGNNGKLQIGWAEIDASGNITYVV